VGIVDEIKAAAAENMHAAGCRLCDSYSRMTPEEVEAIESSFDKVGKEKLATILAANGYAVGRRAIVRHVRERHTTQ